MISAEYARQMARYNRWQNSQLAGFLAELPVDELTRDRGAFFGSILGTANHLLWGDTMWMSRFDGGDAPAGGISDSTGFCPDLPAWQEARTAVDARIGRWAENLTDAELQGDLTWYSGAAGREVSKPLAMLVVHMFNHQTHHRGQIHKMLTESGSSAPVSDLFFMPEDV
ncbi:damage-inducible protein DinB [Ruegeria sediminis]|uniref:Damage-inducible protein DinB n=1 Tax=Ruegeria sediminis TaxID=2583820 RepID=A0ABY2X0M1_9RHOB|nr:DinB family protein [Ruegeria sediminis]TMV08767.1 damage-inducible protein DinB [Ruegeria sediminis]